MMRGRRCGKLLNIIFVISVFSLGMLCGFYYEEATSNKNTGGVRVAPETRNVNDVDGGGHLREPLNLKQQPHPVHPVQPVAVEKVIGNSDSFVGSNKKSNIESVKDSTNPKGGHQLSVNVPIENHQPAVVAHLKGDALHDGKPDSDNHHGDIDRKGFEAPLRLQPVKVKHVGPPAVQGKTLINHSVNKPIQQQNIQEGLPVPGEGNNMVKHQALHKEVHAPAVNIPQNAQANQPQHQQVAPAKDVHPPAFNEGQQQKQQQAPLAAPQNIQNPGSDTAPSIKGKMVLAVVVCGDRTDEALVMLKSAAILTPMPIHFHIFAEDDLHADIAGKIKSWPASFQNRISFKIHPISFPPGENFEEWKKMFKKCATQRLFLPDLLTDTDALLYVDTDILFIKPLQYIWSFFKKFNSTQLAALTPEHEITNIGWYNRFARHPYHGATGLNSGVMLMNLTRMRTFGWSAKILPIYREYKTKITWGDQDLINILFHFHPELVYVYPCEWNIRPDHCMYSLNCQRITTEGVAVIHGNRGVYHNDKQRPFRVIYEAFRDYPFGADLNSGLIQPLRQRFLQQDVATMYCTKALQHPVISTLQQSSYHP
ncbi:glucoside xylosyltransferase 2-like [Asterias rubens]|uniref:glucoside xylosyltransferase 2-like n=1 Tax=Asterias rubens TaxID=7604 RepID=UPI001455BD67|nr:glucoside xylosyltransferase 2-like [Asterias rubens]